jgi:DNA mismatch repair protein MutS
MGARLLRRRLEAPLTARHAIEARLDAVAAFAAAPELRRGLRAALASMPDLERQARRAASGYAGPRELAAIARGIRAAEQMRALLGGAEPLPAEIEGRLAGLEPALADAIEAALSEPAPAVVALGDAIRPGYDAALDELRSGVAAAREWLADLEDTERARTGIRGLKGRRRPGNAT